VSSTRQRPALHFTAQQGWTNDPHGIVHVGDRYHMFFQYNPDGVAWHQACHWGQATSDDLIVWSETDVALSPEEGEIGCWSGSAVVDPDGPVLAYTRIAHDDWGRGAVALARPSLPMAGWVRAPHHSVLDGPPEGMEIIAFRDPQIRPRGDGWVAVIGAGIVGHGGCALQYGVSTDLTEWRFEGVLASRANEERVPVWSGKVWECPQFLQVDGHWVLLVSVWEDDVLHNVVYAIGDYDGSAFQPRTWGTFSHGPQLYATTTFADADASPVAMSWLREVDNLAPEGSPWCSAMSLPHRLSVRDGKLHVSQHPALDDRLPVQLLRTRLSAATATDVDVPAEAPWRLTAKLQTGGQLTADVASAEGGWSISVDTATGLAMIERADGHVLMTIPGRAGVDGVVDVVVDADILEITWSVAEGVGAVRVPTLREATVKIAASGDGAIDLDLRAGERL
jgi:beta-fructofuranosidase